MRHAAALGFLLYQKKQKQAINSYRSAARQETHPDLTHQYGANGLAFVNCAQRGFLLLACFFCLWDKGQGRHAFLVSSENKKVGKISWGVEVQNGESAV